jgi:hypothetical protein
MINKMNRKIKKIFGMKMMARKTRKNLKNKDKEIVIQKRSNF